MMKNKYYFHFIPVNGTMVCFICVVWNSEFVVYSLLETFLLLS